MRYVHAAAAAAAATATDRQSPISETRSLFFPSRGCLYTRSPLEDSRLFGPSPWKILAAANDKKHI